MPAKASLVPAGQHVERVLARFELACPALREFQVAVEVLARQPTLLLLPAAGKPRGRIEFVFTGKGRLRTCAVPPGLTASQRAGVEDLAWAIYEALSRRERPAPRAAH